MKLTKYEQETIITYNEEEGTAGVYTHNKSLLRKLEQLSRARPDECKLEEMSRGGQAADYIIPKSWVKITPKRLLTEAEKAQRLEAVRIARMARNKTGQPVK